MAEGVGFQEERSHETFRAVEWIGTFWLGRRDPVFEAVGPEYSLSVVKQFCQDGGEGRNLKSWFRFELFC